MAKLEEVMKSALELSCEEREILAECLDASIDGRLDKQKWDRFWLEELQRRIDDLRAGRACTISAAEVQARIAKMRS